MSYFFASLLEVTFEVHRLKQLHFTYQHAKAGGSNAASLETKWCKSDGKGIPYPKIRQNNNTTE